MEYFTYIYQGVKEEASRHNIKICCIPAGGFDQPDYRQTKQNEVIQVLGPELFDGLIINEGSFFNYKPITCFPGVLNLIHNIPCVGIGSSFPGICHVNSDNKMGITRLFEHLMEHGCRNFTYIGGPELNSDASERKESFLYNRKKHGLPEGDNTVFSTSFYPAYVEEIIDNITGNGDRLPDAIICANDIIAKNTINELEKRNISVPGQIAVTGFDNSIYSIDNGITTVNIPRKEQGALAVNIINSILEGGKAPEISIVPMEIVIRKTCGCTGDRSQKAILDWYRSNTSDQKQIALDIHRTGQNLNTADNMKQLKNILSESVNWLSIDNYAIYLIPDFGKKGKLFYSCGILKEKLKEKDISDYRTFISGCHDCIETGDVLLMLPLFSKTQFIGFFAVCRLKQDLVLYENLAMQISEAIHMVRQLENAKQQLTKIETSLREKELLLKEIHYRVKNNLQIITSLINLKSMKKDGESLRSIIDDLQTSIGSIALVHESIYKSSQLNRIQLSEYLKSLFRLVNQNGQVSNVITFNLSGDDIYLELQQGINCGLIFSELYQNSVKYGFDPQDKKKKIIEISVSKVNKNCINIRYSDNGKGFDPDSTANRGFGLTIVRNIIADQFGGSMKIDSAAGKGSVFDIVLNI